MRPNQKRQAEPTNLGAKPKISLAHADFNPPDVQRVVVEHVVHHSSLTDPGLSHIRSFSGRTPKPANESDYESWRTQINLLLADKNLSTLTVNRRIMESLLIPAAELVKGLEPDTSPAVLLRVLDAAFGTMQDGEELFTQFLNTLQNPGEGPSNYLQRLQRKLTVVVKRGGVLAAETDKHLLRQFVSGCWDNDIITKLRLDQQKATPPAFAELLLLIRTEEDRQQMKETLMQKHIGSSSAKQRPSLQSQYACSCESTCSSRAELKELKKQMQQLQNQMSVFFSEHRSSAPKSAKRQTEPRSSQSGTKPRPWYCFNCGEDGHVSSSCKNVANPNLVDQKRKQLRNQQKAWNNQKMPLN
ncbi:zinc finger CCHC domain-containing protein 18-like [Nothobranchius furzeri]|uniref:zinc finger CCHC domain-containing protein 18-like n=1 Tax=Nothobranchius furzeri TaxID=105023 RepID=UPI003904850F